MAHGMPHVLRLLLGVIIGDAGRRPGELQVGLLDVVFVPFRASFCTTFLNNYGRCESPMPHVLKLWLRVGKGMLTVWYFCSNKSFCVSKILLR